MSTIVKFPSYVSKEKCLVELWKYTKAVGFGRLHGHQKVSLDDAKNALDNSLMYVDYFHGKPIKTYFSKYPNLDSRLYDRNEPDGPGSMQKIANMFAGKNEDIKPVGVTKQLSKEDGEKLFKSSTLNVRSFDTSDSLFKFLEEQTQQTQQSKTSGKYHKVEKFDRVMLTDEWIKKAKNLKIPYTTDWFMVLDVNHQTYSLMGSMGGKISNIDLNLSGVIKKNLGI